MGKKSRTNYSWINFPERYPKPDSNGMAEYQARLPRERSAAAAQGGAQQEAEAAAPTRRLHETKAQAGRQGAAATLGKTSNPHDLTFAQIIPKILREWIKPNAENVKTRARIIIGDNPILVGSWVDDLRIERVAAGGQVVRWTQPAGLRFVPGSSQFETLGNPTELALRISGTGDVSKLGPKESLT